MHRRFQRVFQFLRELSKDPFSCFGIISVLLFGIIALTAGSILKSPYVLRDFSFFIDSSKTSNQNLFLGPVKNSFLESPELLLVENSSLQASSPPTIFSPQVLGALVEGFEPEDINRIITEYIVEEGDSLWFIAEKFNISLDTLLWANNLNKNSLIQPGQKLVILPVSGVLHHIRAGDTVSDIAKKYKGKVEEIVTFNNLSNEGDIYIGDILVIPNGVLPYPLVISPSSIWVPIAESFFICPISSPCRITQGLHWYNAVDFSHGNCGEPVYAAAAGQVLKVKLTNSTSRWAFSGAGNHLTILHPNGAVTTYGHIANSFVNPGDQVSQGQIIALMGGAPGTPGAGKSTACHLHFGVTGARNPFAK